MYNMPEKSKNTIRTIIYIVLIVILSIIIFLLINQSKNSAQGEILIIPEISMEIGEVGFIEDGETIEDINPDAINNPIRPINSVVPTNIFNTAGTILEVGINHIKIRGNGSNFDDQIKRDLIVVVDEKTSINKTKGIALNELLKIGDNVFIESAYNIHGKQEFLASYINSINSK